MESRGEDDQPVESAGAPPDQRVQQSVVRLLALDALRGLAILLMLLVNNFGLRPSTPRHLTHAGWSGGVHLADFVFPWFLFCVGVAIPYSVASFKRRRLPGWIYDVRVLRRTALLFALGLVVVSSEAQDLRFTLGVLQIIALAYAAGALLYELPLHRRLATAFVLLGAYWVMLRYFNVPGAGVGAFAEGRNIVDHLNRTYLADLGLEGLPLVIPTSALVLIGTAVGDLVRSSLSPNRRLAALVAVGTTLVGLATVWNLSVAFNKPLWTPSYVVLAAGTGTLLLALFHLIIDLKGLRAWAFPLIVFGSNAILAYVLPIVFKSFVLRPMHISTAGWTHVLIFTAAWWLVLYVLYRRRWFLRV